MTPLDKARELLECADSIAVLTGAGISAESGIPTFRGPGGLWRNFRPEDLATPEAFARNPELVWEWYMWRRGLIASAQPNAAHRALANLQSVYSPFTLITQNVDDLHERAGSKDTLKIHGDIWINCCTACDYEQTDTSTVYTRVPLCPRCDAPLRPGVVWFGESLPGLVWQSAFNAARYCRLLIVAGTSAQVYPAAGLIAARRAPTIEINLDDTPYSAAVTVSLRGSCGDILPQLL